MAHRNFWIVIAGESRHDTDEILENLLEHISTDNNFYCCQHNRGDYAAVGGLYDGCFYHACTESVAPNHALTVMERNCRPAADIAGHYMVRPPEVIIHAENAVSFVSENRIRPDTPERRTIEIGSEAHQRALSLESEAARTCVARIQLDACGLDGALECFVYNVDVH